MSAVGAVVAALRQCGQACRVHGTQLAQALARAQADLEGRGDSDYRVRTEAETPEEQTQLIHSSGLAQAFTRAQADLEDQRGPRV